jgi:hypothetical protein
MIAHVADAGEGGGVCVDELVTKCEMEEEEVRGGECERGRLVEIVHQFSLLGV